MKRIVVILLFLFPTSATVAQVSYTLERAFPSLTFSSLLGLQPSNDGTDRIFAVERGGTIRVFNNNDSANVYKTFLDIHTQLVTGYELGLLGFALHPECSTNGYFYINYTSNTDSLRSIVSRFTVSEQNPDSADPSSELVLLRLTQPYENHNGGQLAFGPDGYLYIGFGDGGSGGDPQNRAQNRSLLFGKIIRIDVDNPSNGNNYGIPPDNPFAGDTSGYRKEIFAYGLRNPWRFSFDFTTGTIWCGDVGQETREEIDIIESGRNYGWRIMEGTSCFNPSSNCDTTGLTLPIWDYGRTAGATIIGGYVYHGQALPNLAGQYVYGDYISGNVWALSYGGPGMITNTYLENMGASKLTTMGFDENGELFLCSLSGQIYRLEEHIATGVTGTPPIASFRVFQNYPNPFNSTTTIQYQTPLSGRVVLDVFDPLGRLLGTLVNREEQAGDHRTVWKAEGVGSGFLYVRLTLTTPGVTVSKTIPILLIK